MTAAPDFRTGVRSPRSSLASGFALGVAVTALLLAAGDAVRAARARDEARARALLARGELAPLRARLREREAASIRDATLRHRAELTAEAAPPRVIADLAELLPPDARVGRLDLHYDDRLELDFRVEARTPAAYDRLLEAFAASGRVEAVVPGPETREGEVQASLKAIYRPRGRP